MSLLLHLTSLPVGGFKKKTRYENGPHPVITYSRQERAPEDIEQPPGHLRTHHYSRRDVGCVSLLAILPFSVATPAGAVGVASSSSFSPVGIGGTLGSFIPPFPPQPVSLPRRRLGPAFAVLLLKNGYDTADSLDFIAMDAFQRDFWLLRYAEWEPYTLQYSPLRITQGDLSDPQYFDFISAIQMATITTSMRNGMQTFKEYCGEECPAGTDGEYKLITRDPSLQDNQLLPSKFEALLGMKIYSDLREGFRGVQFNAPPPAAPNCSTDDLVGGVRALLQVFVDQGFCINADVSNVTEGALPGSCSFSVKLDGPCTLWALQSIASRRSNLYPVYDALTVAAFLRASGRSAACSFAWSSTGVTEAWTVT